MKSDWVTAVWQSKGGRQQQQKLFEPSDRKFPSCFELYVPALSPPLLSSPLLSSPLLSIIVAAATSSSLSSGGRSTLLCIVSTMATIRTSNPPLVQLPTLPSAQTLSSLVQAWLSLTKYYTNAFSSLSPTAAGLHSSLPAPLQSALLTLQQHNQHSLFLDSYFTALSSHLNTRIIQPFIATLDSQTGDDEEWLISTFSTSLHTLIAHVTSLHSLTLSLASPTSASSSSSVSRRFHDLFQCLFKLHQTSSAGSLLPALLTAHFDQFVSDPTPSASLLELVSGLHSIGLLSGVSDSLSCKLIERRVKAEDGEWNESRLEALLEYATETVEPFIALLSRSSPSSPASPTHSFLVSHTRRLYCSYLIDHIFDLIIAYPTSLPALSDLAATLPHTHLHHSLTSSLLSSLHARLLLPSTSTTDLLLTLISIKRAMRLVETDEVIGEQAVRLVGQYVRKRPDCVRRVMAMVVGKSNRKEERSGGEEVEEGEGELEDEEGGGDLSAELETEPEKDHSDDSDAEDETVTAALIDASTSTTLHFDNQQPHPFSAVTLTTSAPSATTPLEPWQPDSLSAHPTLVSRVGRHDELLAVLFGLAETTDELMDEYRSLLAVRLVHEDGYARDDEVIRNERMKARVGEEQIRGAEVMVRDIENSRRTVARMNKELDGAPIDTVRALLPSPLPSAVLKASLALTERWSLYFLSHEFWPSSLIEPSLALSSFTPPSLHANLHTIVAATYARLFKPRAIRWLPLLGSVDVTVELADREVRVTCDPLAASVLSVFEGEEVRWSVGEVCERVGLGEEEAAVVRSKLSWWMSRSVLREREGRYEVIETRGSEDTYEGDDEAAGDDEEQEGDKQAGGDSAEVSLYILSTLTTMGPRLSLSQLHNYLKRFPGVSSWNEGQLHDQLSTMEHLGSIAQKDGLFEKR